jgi:pyrroline-5-carboxylate reductase
LHIGLPSQKVAIIGTGAFAQGLASLMIRSGATSGYSVVLSSRKVRSGHTEVFPGLEETPVCQLEETLSQADLQMVSWQQQQLWQQSSVLFAAQAGHTTRFSSFC